MSHVLIRVNQDVSFCFRLLQRFILKWTKPPHASLLVGAVMDLTRGKAELVAENALLLQCAYGAARSKHTYLAAQYRRIASRRGAKRAALAIAHRMLVIIYYLLRERISYREVGKTYFEERSRQAVEKQLVRRLARLGYQVELQPVSQAG